MELSTNQTMLIINKIITKISIELQIANDNNAIDDFFKKYDVTLDEELYFIDRRKHKILVLGALSGKQDDYIKVIKKFGINSNQIDFISDYSKLQHFNCAKLEYSTEYSDIIYGPCPHKMSEMGDTSSFLEKLKKEPNKYPKVIPAESNGILKISINAFKEALLRTRLLEAQYN